MTQGNSKNKKFNLILTINVVFSGISYPFILKFGNVILCDPPAAGGQSLRVSFSTQFVYLSFVKSSDVISLLEPKTKSNSSLSLNIFVKIFFRRYI